MLALADLAAAQWGMVTTAQAAGVGVTALRLSRMTRDGYLSRMRHGVYKIAGTPGHPHDEVRAAWLATDTRLTRAERLEHDEPGVAVSHRSAAVIHRLGDMDADLIELTAETRRQPRDPGVRVHRGNVSAQRWTLVDGLPVTTVLATIEDLAAAGLDGSHLAGVVRDALGRDLVDPDALQDVLRPYAHRYGAPIGDAEKMIDGLLQQAAPSRATLRAASPAVNAQLAQALSAADWVADASRATAVFKDAVSAAERWQDQTRPLRESYAAIQRSIDAAGVIKPDTLAALRDVVAKASAGIDPETAATMQRIVEAAARAQAVQQQHLPSSTGGGK